MYEERCNIKIHTFQAFDGDSFLVTICESEKEINILIVGIKKHIRIILNRIYFICLSKEKKLIS